MLALPLALILLAPAAPAEIYRWVDDNGSVHFTDNLFQVPPEYRGRVKSMDDRLPPARPPRKIPLAPSDMGYVVEARVNGAGPVHLIVDTGATATVISPDAARRLGLRVRRDPPVRLRTAGGAVDAGWARVEAIDVAGWKAGPLRVVVHDAVSGADGLLGMDYLGAFHVEIRAEGPYLVLSPP